MFADVTSNYAPTKIILVGRCALTNDPGSARHVRKHPQNQSSPHEIRGELDTDLYMALDQTLSPPRVRVWLARLGSHSSHVVSLARLSSCESLASETTSHDPKNGSHVTYVTKARNESFPHTRECAALQ